MSEATAGDPFRPFVVEVDDGARLVLSRGRSRSEWALRVGLYSLVLLLVGLEVLIAYVMLTHADSLGVVLQGLTYGVTLYIILRVALFGFLFEGPRRVVVVRGELELVYRGAVRRISEPVLGPVAIVARSTEEVTKHGDVSRWLALEVRTYARTVALWSLRLDPPGESTREAAASEAAALLAARLGVPLELDVPPSVRSETGG
ncbi:hypothetical protein OV090_42975 [Nannocystis sp. RBIL2]|uniref:hypothetical protein n=1 Tax=Nannocystis sp. RBIL2 TaxID=2996788 RepID=UPI0022720638|nr:hypothetical protein [Nannocystis sp. RBIL2]MCY1071585.1 hypothetical protein [Nannocystis sp. RBIL2]